MIETFGNTLAENLFDDRQTKTTRSFPPELRRTARRKLFYLQDTSELKDLRVPPGNRLERLKGARQGWYSTRINVQWKVVFHWLSGNAFDVQIIDYH
jgi:proteic killer suppression protein